MSDVTEPDDGEAAEAPAETPEEEERPTEDVRPEDQPEGAVGPDDLVQVPQPPEVNEEERPDD